VCVERESGERACACGREHECRHGVVSYVAAAKAAAGTEAGEATAAAALRDDSHTTHAVCQWSGQYGECGALADSG
jgi:hypothetical protein